MTTRTAYFSSKAIAVVAALAGTALLTADFADARGGRGGSFGSRGSKTFDAPAATRTAPSASPVQKSITQPGKSGATAAAAQSSRGSMVKNLLLGGLIGAGLASLFGFGGGFAAMLGFILQMALIAGIVMLVIAFFRSRSAANQPALAQAAAGGARRPEADAAYRSGLGGGMSAPVPELAIVGDDYNTFERLLKEIQLAYTNGDIAALGDRVTPEVLSEFARELDENKRKGLSNDLSEPKLLQGDLAETWREAGGEYATVAMRYEIIDALVDQKTGRVVQGSTTEPQQVTEVWTFRRPVGGNASQWELSAIQQAG
ncbi:MAG: TIM44-like domain-containing protein [Hyphomicrobiaceae bacterium]|nr:TIM44-like domain-containing protein [Hyphomicrobiaceae bacterium]